MKLNIKGLAFVGFAAAIFAASAQADDKQIVTSKSYTEATYQKLANKLAQGDDTTAKLGLGDDNVDDTHYPTAKAVAQALASNASATTYTADEETIHLDDNEFSAKTGVIAENSDDLVKSGTLYTEFATKQNKQVGAANNGATPSTDNGKLMIVGTDGKIAMAPDTLDVGTDTKGVYILDGVPKATTYSVGMNVPAAPDTDAANKVLAGDGNWKGVFTGATENTAGTTGLVKAPATTERGKFLKGDGTWGVPDNTTYETLSSNDVSTGTGTTGKLITAAQHFAKQDKQIGTATTDTGRLVTVDADGKIGMAANNADVGSATKGVYIHNGVPTATTYSLSTNIPAPTGCTDAAPCALVATTSGAAWVSMAQPAAQQQQSGN